MVVHSPGLSCTVSPSSLLKLYKSLQCPSAPLDVTGVTRKFVVNDIAHHPLQISPPASWEGLPLPAAALGWALPSSWNSLIHAHKTLTQSHWKVAALTSLETGKGWKDRLPFFFTTIKWPRTSLRQCRHVQTLFRKGSLPGRGHVTIQLVYSFFKPLHSKNLPFHWKNSHLLGPPPVSSYKVPSQGFIVLSIFYLSKDYCACHLPRS